MREFLPLTDEQREIQRVAREFAATSLAPYAADWDRDGTYDPSVVGRMAELGFLGMTAPAAFGGLGLDTVTYLLAIEEIAAADAATAVLLSVHNSLPTYMLVGHGTDEQRDRFLRPMARGDLLGA